METLKHHKLRFLITLILVGFYGIVSNFLIDENFTPIAIVFIWLISTVTLTYLLGIIWRYKLVLMTDAQNQVNHKSDILEQTEKRKRANLDTVLRDLSDDDLVRLRQRLQDGTVDDEVLYDNLVGDDGELLTRESYT